VGAIRNIIPVGPQWIHGRFDPGRANDENAIPAAQVFLERDMTPGFGPEEAGEIGSLAVSELGEEPTGGAEPTVGVPGQGAVGSEAVGTAGEGEAGVVIPDFGHQERNFGVRDVGRVGDDEVEGGVRGQVGVRAEGVLEVKRDAVEQAEVGRVGAGDVEGFRGQVEGVDVGVGMRGREMEGEASGAGAEVGDAGVWDIGDEFPGEEGELFGFRARYEDMPGDLEGQMEEGRGADEMLEGDASGALLDEVVELAEGLGCGFRSQADASSEERDAGDVFEEALGFEGGFVDSGRGQRFGRL
jgi:hypothetical protein